jgi:hypothetical protein
MPCQWGRRCTNVAVIVAYTADASPFYEDVSRDRRDIIPAGFSSPNTGVQLRWDVRLLIFRKIIIPPRAEKVGIFLALYADTRVVTCETETDPQTSRATS